MTHEEQFGTVNEAELIMLRGTGDFSIDWSNPQQYEPVLNRQICDSHLNELSRHWHRTKYYHGTYTKTSEVRKKACSVPLNIELNHNKPETENLVPLSKIFAEAVLEKHGILLPVGIGKNFLANLLKISICF
jgi:hypothetical protein